MNFFDEKGLLFYPWLILIVLFLCSILVVLFVRGAIRWENNKKLFYSFLVLLVVVDITSFGVSTYQSLYPKLITKELYYYSEEENPVRITSVLAFQDSDGMVAKLKMAPSTKKKYYPNGTLVREHIYEVTYDARHKCIVGISLKSDLPKRSRKDVTEKYDSQVKHYRQINPSEDIKIYQETMTFEKDGSWSRQDMIDYVFSDATGEYHMFYENRENLLNYLGLEEFYDFQSGQKYVMTYCESVEGSTKLLDIEITS